MMLVLLVVLTAAQFTVGYPYCGCAEARPNEYNCTFGQYNDHCGRAFCRLAPGDRCRVRCDVDPCAPGTYCRTDYDSPRCYGCSMNGPVYQCYQAK